MTKKPRGANQLLDRNSFELELGEPPANFDPVQAASAERAAITLNRAAEHEALNLAAAIDILDFGAGEGGPTWALARLAAMNGGSVEAVEFDEGKAARIISSGALPAANVHVEDGFDFLDTAVREGRGFDLIVAAMLGPDHKGDLARRLIEKGLPALTDQGALLIYSDERTMEVVEQDIKWRHLVRHPILGVSLGHGDYIDNAIVLPKQ